MDWDWIAGRLTQMLWPDQLKPLLQAQREIIRVIERDLARIQSQRPQPHQHVQAQQQQQGQVHSVDNAEADGIDKSGMDGLVDAADL